MKKLLAVFILTAFSLLGQGFASFNFTADLQGQLDTRPGTWGYQDSHTWKVPFFPPDGKMVRIEQITGDLVAWPLGQRPPGKYAGVLLSLGRTQQYLPPWCSFCNANTFLYIQMPVFLGRAPFSHYNLGFLLGPDNIMEVKVASWLNQLNAEIHIEPTFVVKYSFVDPKAGGEYPIDGIIEYKPAQASK